jgi:hypothetical protein
MTMVICVSVFFLYVGLAKVANLTNIYSYKLLLRIYHMSVLCILFNLLQPPGIEVPIVRKH